jgi:ribose transport system ATP-binding protein
LGARDLAAGHRLEAATFSLKRGEILGVAGLQGMGQLDLFLACFGMTDVHAGQVFIDGRPVTIASPTDALRPNIGMGFLPEDRKTEALFVELDGKHNASLPIIESFCRFGLVQSGREESAVAGAFGRVEVDRRALWTPVKSFSGGNQQKIALAKWLLAQSRILLLFDPTRGIDVGTKHELYVLMRAYAEAGGSILFHSTEIPELVHLCDRVVVLYGGKIVSEIGAAALTENEIMHAALGGDAKRIAA